MSSNWGSTSDQVVDNIRRWRGWNQWSREDLADACAKAGYPKITAAVITNIEGGRRDQYGRRRRHVTVDELVAFADVFDIPKSDLLYPEGPS